VTDDDDHRYYDDGPGDEPEERLFEDGTCVPADDPLPSCVTFSRIVEEPEYDDEGFVSGVSRYVETARATLELRGRRTVPVPRRIVHVAATARRAVGGRRHGRSRVGARRARSSGRPAEDPSDPTDALRVGGVR
jgi:hypothetical protein